MLNMAIANTVVKTYVEEKIPCFMWGPPGVGKSELVAQISKEMNRNLIDIRTILLDPVDIRGLPVATKDSAKWLIPDFLPNEKRDGKKGILFLDELNTAPPSVMNACLQLVLNRRVGEYMLPDGWDIIAAGNRQEDRAAVNRLPRPLANRFGHVEIVADVETWVQWANNNGVDEKVVYFIRYRPVLLHAQLAENQNNEENAFPSPRSWVKVSSIINKERNIRRHLVRGLVGIGPEGELDAYISTAEMLPDIDDILENPKKVKVPDDPSALFALSGALARVATKKNFKNVYTYAKRLGSEFEVVTVLDATGRDRELCDTVTYNEFATRNANLQI